MWTGRWTLMAILLLALAVRLVAAAWWEQRLRADQRFGLADSESYWTLGKAIAQGEAYEYGGPDARIFRTPGYPLVLAPIILVAGDTPLARCIARVVGAVLGTACVALMMVWARLLFRSECTAACAGLIAAFYPGLIALSILVLSEALFCPLITAQLVCWTRADQTRGRLSWVWSLSAGALAGAASLARPSWLLFVPFAGCAALLFASHRGHRTITLLLMMVGLSVVMAPWWIRNYQVVGRFVPTTLQVGASLYDGLNPGATGASDMTFVEQYYRTANGQRREGKFSEGAHLEVVLDERMKRDALQWASRHPLRALKLATVKFARMWNVWPNDDQFRGLGIRMVIAAGYIPVIVLALVGAWSFVRRGFVFGLCCLPAVYLTALHVIFVSSLRYREPAMIGGILLAAGVLCGERKKLVAQ